VLEVVGQTLRWKPVAGAEVYVLATKVPGAEVRYQQVRGLSVTPPPVPGTEVTYGLRADVDGSPWAREVTIAYPTDADAGFEAGLVTNSDIVGAAAWIQAGLRPALVRAEFPIATPAADLREAVAAHAANGSRLLLLAGFAGDMPTPAEARNLARWAAEFGPGGTFWTNRPDGHLAVREIEFGNETSFGYQYGDAAGDDSYAARARDYALRFRDAQEAVAGANPAVRLLAQADSGGSEGSEWVDAMFEAVPELASLVGGWTVHPYGPWADAERRVDQLVSQTAERGAGHDIPIWITEWGISTDDGRCLSDNYGWDPCMTYADAGAALLEAVARLRAAHGTRLRALIVYQGHDQRPSGTSTEREHYFGVLRLDGAEKGAYTEAVRAVLAAGA
jgi:hypothetical protein